MANSEACVEHKKLFNEWLFNTSSNSSFISAEDLDTVQNFLLSKTDGRSNNISANLKRRIKSNNFMLANFPSASNCVCIVETSEEKNKDVSNICILEYLFIPIALAICRIQEKMTDWMTDLKL